MDAHAGRGMMAPKRQFPGPSQPATPSLGACCGSGAKSGKSFTARAFGDLDCDGVYSTFELTGNTCVRWARAYLRLRDSCADTRNCLGDCLA